MLLNFKLHLKINTCLPDSKWPLIQYENEANQSMVVYQITK